MAKRLCVTDVGAKTIFRRGPCSFDFALGPCERWGSVEPDEARTGLNEEFWRDFLNGGHSKEHTLRRVLKMIPHEPRCRLCAAPFAGAGAPLMRLVGKKPSDKNPNWCGTCFKFMEKHHGGAEI